MPGYKNDEKEDSLPAWWQWGAACEFGTFHPLGLALVHSEHTSNKAFPLDTEALDQTCTVFYLTRYL